MRTLTVIGFLAAIAFIGACKEEPPPKPAEPPPKEEPAVEAEPVHPLMALRQAYGLPFPPEVIWVRKGPNFIEVGTNLRVSELEEFFRTRLVDYEFVDVGPNDLRIVGLRSTMPRINVMKRAPRVPVSVRYVQQVAAENEVSAARVEAEKPVPGKEVTTKLGDGNLLAPGAIYGQPYTPRPGDPLYKEKYRSNFGKPFGTWILN